MVVGAQHSDRRRCLREPVGVHEVDVGQQLEGALQHRHRHACAAVRQRAERRRSTSGITLENGDDACQHRRHHEGVGDRLGRRQLQPVVGVEARHRYDAPTDVSRRQHGGDTGDMERGDGDEGGLLLSRRSELERVEEVGGQVVVVEHGRLGGRRRTRREQQDGGARGLVDEGQTVIAPVRPRLIETGRGLEPGQKFGLGRRRQPEVERCVADTRPTGAEEGDGEVVAVRQQRRQRGCCRIRRAKALSNAPRRSAHIGERHVTDSSPVPEAVGRHLQDHGDVHTTGVSRTRAAAWPL